MKRTLLTALCLVAATAIWAQQTTEMVVSMTDGTRQVIDIQKIDRVTFQTRPATPDRLTLSCELTEVTPVSATYVITPSNDDDTYYQFLMSEETMNRMIQEYGNLQYHDQAWWEYIASFTDGATWEDAMRELMVRGQQIFHSEDIIYTLSPETTYIIYYYGLADDGTMTTDIYQTRFTTPKPADSANSFTISDVWATASSVTATVTPANNDPYFVTAQSRKAVESRLSSGMTLREVAQDFINTIAFYGDITASLYQGQQTITLHCGLEDTDYVLIVCGYNDGVSTDVTTYDFHTLP